MDSLTDATERPGTGEELPKGMERRLVLRLLSYWRGLSEDGVLPSFAAIDPSAMKDMWESCFVLDAVGHEADPVFRTVGAAFAEHSPIDLIDRRVSEARANTLVHASVSYIHEVICKGVPISRGGEFYKADGVKVLYRSIVLPMSDDGETISGLLCAANCREVTEG